MKLNLTSTDDYQALTKLLTSSKATFKGIPSDLNLERTVGAQLITALKIFSFSKIITSYLRGNISNSTTHFGFALDIKGDVANDPHVKGISPSYMMRPKLTSWLLDRRSEFEKIRVVVLVEENHIHFHSREVELYRPELKQIDTLSYKPTYFPGYKRAAKEKVIIESEGYNSIRPLIYAPQLDIYPRDLNSL